MTREAKVGWVPPWWGGGGAYSLAQSFNCTLRLSHYNGGTSEESTFSVAAKCQARLYESSWHYLTAIAMICSRFWLKPQATFGSPWSVKSPGNFDFRHSTPPPLPPHSALCLSMSCRAESLRHCTAHKPPPRFGPLIYSSDSFMFVSVTSSPLQGATVLVEFKWKVNWIFFSAGIIRTSFTAFSFRSQRPHNVSKRIQSAWGLQEITRETFPSY